MLGRMFTDPPHRATEQVNQVPLVLALDGLYRNVHTTLLEVEDRNGRIAGGSSTSRSDLDSAGDQHLAGELYDG
jgi:hypothetical protein